MWVFGLEIHREPESREQNVNEECFVRAKRL